MELTVYKTSGDKTEKKVELDDSLFGIKPNDEVLSLVVKSYLANKRQGTSKTKGRSEVKGSTKKIRKQKGTGSARVGDIKNPLFRGGGRVFGPQPRDYSFKLNKKMKSLARKSALTYKAKDENIIIIEDFSFEEAKTSEFQNILENLKITTDKSLLLIANNDKNIYLSSRNIKNTEVNVVDELTTYKIMNAKKILFTESSLNKFQEASKK